MDKKHRLILTAILAVFVTTMFSYGYFQLVINGDLSTTTDNVVASSNRKSLIFNYDINGEEDLGSFSLAPGESVEKSFTVTNNSLVGNEPIAYDLIWDVIKNTFTLKTYLHYEITCASSNGGTCTGLEDTLVPDTNANYSIINNISIASGETQTFTMTITYILAISENQDIDKTAKLSGKVSIREHDASIVTPVEPVSYSYMVSTIVEDVPGNTIQAVVLDSSSFSINEDTESFVVSASNLNPDYYYMGLSYDNSKVNASYDISTNQLTLSNFTASDSIIIYYKSRDKILADASVCSDNTLECNLRSNYDSLGLTKVFHEPTTYVNIPTISFRYQGATADNYITVDGVRNRIIGVFQETSTMVDAPTNDVSWKVKAIYDEYSEDGSVLSSLWKSVNVEDVELAENLDGIFDELTPIDNSIWYYGIIDVNNDHMETVYENERTTNSSLRTNSKYGLMNVSDIAYSFTSSCPLTHTLMDLVETEDECLGYNWLLEYNLNVIPPNNQYDLDAELLYAYKGNIGMPLVTIEYDFPEGSADIYYLIRPTFYLSHSVSKTSGNGTLTTPYEIS